MSFSRGPTSQRDLVVEDDDEPDYDGDRRRDLDDGLSAACRVYSGWVMYRGPGIIGLPARESDYRARDYCCRYP